jgi:acetyl esterase/lipase
MLYKARAEDDMRLFGVTLAWAVIAAGTLHAAPAPVPAKPPIKKTSPETPAKPAAKAAGKTSSAKPASSPHRPRSKSVTQAPAPPPIPVPVDPVALPYPGGVIAMRDLTYAALPGFRPLTLDLYQPAPVDRDSLKPLLIFVHGGDWAGGDKRHGGGFENFPAILASLASHNYVVASLDYRLAGEAHFPAALQDVKSAIRWLRAHATAYGIDTTRVAVWGEEAGGQLAALAGTSCGVAALEPPGGDKPSDCAEAVIVWNGITDLASLASDSGRDAPKPDADPTPEGAYLGCEPAACAPGLAHNASPIAYVGANTPPFLIQRSADKSVPPAQAKKLFDALKEAQVPAQLADGDDADSANSALSALLDFLDKTFPRNVPPAPPTSGASPH